MPVKRAERDLTNKVVQNLREGGRNSVEADESLNNASRKLVAAMAEKHGDVWLGRFNLHGEDRGKAEKVLWKWDGSTVLNFSADFVLPVEGEELVRMILARDAAPYTGTKADAKVVADIIEQVLALGGKHLFWS